MQCGFRRPIMARYHPNQDDRYDRIDQRQQQATLERRRRPQRCRGLKSEEMWEQRAICHAGIAEETLHPVKEGAQALDIDTRYDIFPRKALAKRVIGCSGWASLFGSAGREDPKVAPVHDREYERAYPADNSENSRQRYRQIARSPSQPDDR
jgi:hypothetical protein